LDISPQDIAAWYKKIEMIGIEIKSLDQDVDPGRLKLKTKFMNQHFINELDKIGLQLIHITGTYEGKVNVLLEGKTTG
jgi:CHAT domain-containing protein